jgi:uncharacterized protein YktA (UPF0223 family)
MKNKELILAKMFGFNSVEELNEMREKTEKLKKSFEVEASDKLTEDLKNGVIKINPHIHKDYLENRFEKEFIEKCLNDIRNRPSTDYIFDVVLENKGDKSCIDYGFDYDLINIEGLKESVKHIEQVVLGCIEEYDLEEYKKNFDRIIELLEDNLCDYLLAYKKLVDSNKMLNEIVFSSLQYKRIYSPFENQKTYSYYIDNEINIKAIKKTNEKTYSYNIDNVINVIQAIQKTNEKNFEKSFDKRTHELAELYKHVKTLLFVFNKY